MVGLIRMTTSTERVVNTELSLLAVSSAAGTAVGTVVRRLQTDLVLLDEAADVLRQLLLGGCRGDHRGVSFAGKVKRTKEVVVAIAIAATGRGGGGGGGGTPGVRG